MRRSDGVEKIVHLCVIHGATYSTIKGSFASEGFPPPGNPRALLVFAWVTVLAGSLYAQPDEEEHVPDSIGIVKKIEFAHQMIYFGREAKSPEAIIAGAVLLHQNPTVELKGESERAEKVASMKPADLLKEARAMRPKDQALAAYLEKLSSDFDDLSRDVDLGLKSQTFSIKKGAVSKHEITMPAQGGSMGVLSSPITTTETKVVMIPTTVKGKTVLEKKTVTTSVTKTPTLAVTISVDGKVLATGQANPSFSNNFAAASPPKKYMVSIASPAADARYVLTSKFAIVPVVARVGDRPINDATADTALKRGDVLVKFFGPTTKVTATQLAIEGEQTVAQRLIGAFHTELRKGDPKGFHVALYLGGGKTAEANGADASSALVAPFTIDYHAGYIFQVFRPNDAKMADGAAHVAETWANARRMKYLVPIAVPFVLSSFGPKARAETLDFGRFADKAGGPPDVKSMFCSEFVIASYQAAVVKGLLAKNPKLKTGDVAVPIGINVQASHTSPFVFQSHLTAAVEQGLWRKIGEVLVRPK
ncbi:MAG: hypothetical protein EXR98_18040 [Gemmataceae bacterium]|nr:hypothetical protein [Gemmataceae bacterium]